MTKAHYLAEVTRALELYPEEVRSLVADYQPMTEEERIADITRALDEFPEEAYMIGYRVRPRHPVKRKAADRKPRARKGPARKNGA